MTSLTTIGLGDIVPKSNIERLVVALGLLIGVNVQSYVMGNLIDILNVVRKFNEVESEAE